MIDNVKWGRLFVAWVAIASSACQPKAPPPANQDDIASARAFVADFYAWYHPDSVTMKGIDDALTQRRGAFSVELAQLIQLDRECTRRSQSICALDFDPILNSQDPCERYEVGEARRSVEVDLVPVVSVCGGRRDTIPVVTVMLFPGDSSGWEIINFTYPDNKRLSDILFQYYHKPQ